MKLTKGQRRDIDLCRYFYPCDPTDEDIQEYLDMSEKGKGGNRGKFSDNPLVVGKTRRGLAMEMYEEGVLEGTMPYFTLLGGYASNKNKHKPIPRFVVDFMKKEMFRGMDANIIEEVYSNLCEQ